MACTLFDHLITKLGMLMRRIYHHSISVLIPCEPNPCHMYSERSLLSNTSGNNVIALWEIFHTARNIPRFSESKASVSTLRWSNRVRLSSSLQVHWMSSPRSSLLALAEFEGSSLRSCFQVRACWVSACCLSWEYIVGFGWVFRVSFLHHRVPIQISQAVRIAHILQRIFLLRRFLDEIHWPRLGHFRTFIGRAFLNSL